jgi:hypothetical protein
MEPTASLGCNVFALFWKNTGDAERRGYLDLKKYIFGLPRRFVWIKPHTICKNRQNGVHSLARVQCFWFILENQGYAGRRG